MSKQQRTAKRRTCTTSTVLALTLSLSLLFIVSSCSVNKNVESIDESSKNIADQTQRLADASEKISKSIDQFASMFEQALTLFAKLLEEYDGADNDVDIDDSIDDDDDIELEVQAVWKDFVDFGFKLDLPQWQNKKDTKFPKSKENIISGYRCIDRSVELSNIRDLLLAYNDYHLIDDIMGPELAIKLGPIKRKIRAVRMEKSKSFTLKTQFKEGRPIHRNIIQFVLRPLNLKNEDNDVFPHFHTYCTIQGKEEGLTQSCKLITKIRKNGIQTQLARFALNDFNSTIDVIKHGPRCKDSLQINYHIQLLTNVPEVNLIKTRIAGIFVPFVNLIFDEQKFFESYYNSFYNLLIDNL